MRAKLIFSAVVMTASIVAPVLALSKQQINAHHREIAQSYAACVVARKMAKADSFVLSSEDKFDNLPNDMGLIIPDCLVSLNPIDDNKILQILFFGESYRFALAEALVRKEFRLSGYKDFGDKPRLSHPTMPDKNAFLKRMTSLEDEKERIAATKRYKEVFTSAWLSRYSECVVRSNPEKARMLVLSKPESSNEDAILKEMGQILSDCLANGTLTFSRDRLRGAVALTYYRLAQATPSSIDGKSQ